MHGPKPTHTARGLLACPPAPPGRVSQHTAGPPNTQLALRVLPLPQAPREQEHISQGEAWDWLHIRAQWGQRPQQAQSRSGVRVGHHLQQSTRGPATGHMASLAEAARPSMETGATGRGRSRPRHIYSGAHSHFPELSFNRSSSDSSIVPF